MWSPDRLDRRNNWAYILVSARKGIKLYWEIVLSVDLWKMAKLRSW